MTQHDTGEALSPFERIAARWTTRAGVTRGTMMGHTCLRVDGAFFASADRSGARLIVKLPAPVVRRHLDEGSGEPFAPNGRTFREWIAIPVRDVDSWDAFVEAAHDFVRSHP